MKKPVNTKIYFLAILLVAIFTVAAFSGCKKTGNAGPMVLDPKKFDSKNIKVAYIDSDRLIVEFPEIAQFVDKKVKENLKIIELAKARHNLSETERKQLERKTQDFMLAEDHLVLDFTNTVRDASAKVADEKKFDLVMDNRTSSPILEYGGTDITEEVRVKIKEIKKSRETTEAK